MVVLQSKHVLETAQTATGLGTEVIKATQHENSSVLTPTRMGYT